MFNYIAAAVLAGAAITAASGLQAATVDGLQLSAEYLFPDTDTVYPNATATGPFTVGAGLDATISVEDVTDILLDFGGSALTLTFSTTLLSPTWLNHPFNGVKVSMLSDAWFTGFSQIGGSINAAGTSFDGSNLFINLANVSYVNGSTMTFDVAVAPVPLPAGLPLLAAGIAGFAVLRRRQRTA